MNTKGKTSGFIWFIAIAAVAILGIMAYALFGGVRQTSFGDGDGVVPEGTIAQGQLCAGAPTATWSTEDKFGTNAVTGTSYFNVNGNPATTTYSAPNIGDKYKYWILNESWYIQPLEGTVTECATQKISKSGIKNASATLTAYDVVNAQTVTNGLYNTSLGASGSASIRYTFDPTGDKGFMPFGGVLVLEQNSTIPLSGVKCTGSFVTSNTGSDAFTVTYTMSKPTTHNYKVYKILTSIEDGSGKPVTIECEFENGATAAGNGPYYATLIPANYYYAKDGTIKLDVEQAANELTTRTGYGKLVATSWFA